MLDDKVEEREDTSSLVCCNDTMGPLQEPAGLDRGTVEMGEGRMGSGETNTPELLVVFSRVEDCRLLYIERLFEGLLVMC